MPFLLGLIKSPKVIFGALILAAITAAGIWVNGLLLENANLETEVSNKAAEITSLNRDVADAKKVNDGNVSELNKLRADDARRKSTIADLEVKLANAKGKTVTVYTTIDNATEADDGPIAPVLASTIMMLQDIADGKTAEKNDEKPIID